jgi:predicted membrane protein
VSEGTVTPLRRTSVALMGGLRASGRVRVEDRILRVTTLGGMDLDLSEADFTAPRVTIVKVSLIGGVELTVPADARVKVRSLSIGGVKVEPGASDATGPEIVVHNYGLLGGVKVTRRR